MKDTSQPWRTAPVGCSTEAPECRTAEISSQQTFAYLRGQDLPHNHLVGFGLSQTVGDEPGFVVEMDIETPEGRQQVSFWTTADAGNRLGSFLAKTPPQP